MLTYSSDLDLSVKSFVDAVTKRDPEGEFYPLFIIVCFVEIKHYLGESKGE